jgi:hypothetical protein
MRNALEHSAFDRMTHIIMPKIILILNIMPFGTLIFELMTHTIMTKMSFNIMSFNIMTLYNSIQLIDGIITLGFMTLPIRNDTE